MVYTSYTSLLNDLKTIGEKISSSVGVSVNRSYETKELNNVQIKFDNFVQFLLDDDEVEYYEKELQWYLNLYDYDNPSVYNKFIKDLRKLAEEKIKCKNRCGPNSNYGEICLRLKNHVGLTQFDWCIEKLKNDKFTRQAVAFYNTPNYQYLNNNDFVCCLSQMFNVKDNKLNTVVNSRSNDIINSFRFDMIWWRIFQTKIYNALLDVYPTLEMGYLFVNIFSAHYYIKDEYKIDIINKISNDNKFKSVGDIYL